MNNHFKKEDDSVSNCSRSSSQMGALCINSNIKKKSLGLSHSKNHMTSIQKEVHKSQQRDHSKKNIYTDQSISRRGFTDQLTPSSKSISMSSDMTKNLSSLIGTSHKFEMNTVGYLNRNEISKAGIYNNRTVDDSRI